MSVAFVDTETTSLDPDREVWEVAVILGGQGAPDATLTFQWFVDVCLDKANPESLAVGGFYERHPMGRYLSGREEVEPTPGSSFNLMTRQHTALTLARLTHGLHLVGAAPCFDAVVIERLLRTWFQLPGWHHHLIDIETLAYGWLHGRVTQARQLFDTDDEDRVTELRSALPSLPWKSDELSRVCGVEPPSDEERHTALGDAQWVKRWYQTLVGGGDE